MTTEHQAMRELLGAYVLGQLGESEHTEVARHLVGCSGCRAEVEALAPVASALRELDPLDVASLEETELGDQVARGLRAHRSDRARTRLRRVGGGLLAAASVAAAFAGGVWYAGPRTEPPVVPMTVRQAAPGVSADAALVRHTWGTELKLAATGLTDGASYRVTFVRDDGSQVGAGSFLGTGPRPLNCSVNAALPLDDAAELMVTDSTGALVIDADLR